MKRESILKILLTVIFSLVFLANVAYGGATLTVNTSTGGFVCDDKLSLLEAMTLAGTSGNPALMTTGEKNQISGATWVVAPEIPSCGGVGWYAVDGVGSNFADDIKFSDNVGTIFGMVGLSKNDDIDGLKPNGQKVILDGTGQSSPNNGITIDPESGSQVRNLIIRNHPTNGIFAQALNGAKFEGLEIYNNGNNGMSIGFAGGTTNKNSRNVTIGGTEPQHRNKIYGNGGHGILIAALPSADRFPDEGILILNNLIGTSDGVSDNGNGGRGISLMNAFGVTIGDATGATRNIIGGNGNDGIALDGAACISNTIIGNFIGTSESSGAPLGNASSGIALLNDAGSTADFISTGPNYIGKPGLGNVISANNFGIFIADPNTSKNRVQGNLIGTNIGGNTDLGNAADGIYFVNGTFDNQIGGTGTGEGNLIAFNRNGIRADSGLRNSFRRNRIFSNDLLGIDLAPVGVTPNDAGDPDAGANNLQNYPVITFVNAQTSSVNIQGTFNGAASQTLTLEFFGSTGVDATGFGEGRNFIGTINVTTNASGSATFNQTFAAGLSTVGTWVTATATDASGNTSEYSQARNICADLTLSSPGMIAFGNGGPAGFSVSTSAGCTFTAQSNAAWMQVGLVAAGTVNFTIFPNATAAQRTGAIGIFYNNGSLGTFQNFNVFQQGGGRKPFFDFDGDTKTDIAIFRPVDGSWWYVRSSDSQNRVYSFGNSTDRVVPADFTGDGRTDIAIWRPASGMWFVQRSEDNSFFSFPFGTNGDIPAPADYDADGRADAAVFRPSTATWYILRSSDGGTTIVNFGTGGDVPVTGDYDGDGRADIAVFRPSGGSWWIRRSSDNAVYSTSFGLGTDKPVPADYTGDGKADIAVWRPSTGHWFVLRSEDFSYFDVPFGTTGDIPVAGDYDGDGKADFAVFRPSTATWYVQRTTAGLLIAAFGNATDKPVPSAFVP
jgi:hypothetical protein